MVAAAERRVRPLVRETYLEPSPDLSALGSARVLLKLENLQHTGSFKARGAMSEILSLSEADRDRGVVAASTGNHGAAVAYSLSRLGATGVVFVPEDASPGKVRAIERHGARLRVRSFDAQPRPAGRIPATGHDVHLLELQSLRGLEGDRQRSRLLQPQAAQVQRSVGRRHEVRAAPGRRKGALHACA